MMAALVARILELSTRPNIGNVLREALFTAPAIPNPTPIRLVIQTSTMPSPIMVLTAGVAPPVL